MSWSLKLSNDISRITNMHESLNIISTKIGKNENVYSELQSKEKTNVTNLGGEEEAIIISEDRKYNFAS